ncbi:MAG TPA: Ig-like domain-containing protein, partial [Polyangiaceae bacterium]|nr:Ig-like domain-containing protein [Polyangiaceae bacterium]
DAGADATSDAGADAPSLDASDAGADAPSLDASDAGDVTPPVVVSITPADSASGVATLPSIVVTFSEAMQPASLTASTTGTSCSGSLQLSADGFSTCVPLAGAPTPSAANTVFAVAPAIGLQSLGKYQLRVTTAAKDASGNPLSADHTQPAAWTVRYHHSIVIDGNNDFTADETLSTSTTGYTAYAAWDDTFFYAGLKGPDVSSASATKFWVCYLGSTAGTTTGVSYNTQQPGLPFAAKWHVRWKSDNTFTDALVFGSAWGPASWSFAGDILQKNDYVEMRVGWTDFAETITTLKFATYMLNEQGSSEFSYAAAPAAAFTDSYDADVAKYFAFDPAASVTPKQSPILP